MRRQWRLWSAKPLWWLWQLLWFSGQQLLFTVAVWRLLLRLWRFGGRFLTEEGNKVEERGFLDLGFCLWWRRRRWRWWKPGTGPQREGGRGPRRKAAGRWPVEPIFAVDGAAFHRFTLQTIFLSERRQNVTASPSGASVPSNFLFTPVADRSGGAVIGREWAVIGGRLAGR